MTSQLVAGFQETETADWKTFWKCSLLSVQQFLEPHAMQACILLLHYSSLIGFNWMFWLDENEYEQFHIILYQYKLKKIPWTEIERRDWTILPHSVSSTL